MSSREDIDRLDEQIKNLQNKDKTENVEKNKLNDVIIHRNDEYEDFDDSDTKRVENIEEIEELEEEKTKKIDVVSDISEEKVEDENLNEEDVKDEVLESTESSCDIASVDDNKEEVLNKVEVDDNNGKNNKNFKIIIGIIVGILVLIIIILLLFVFKKDKDTDNKKKKEDDDKTVVKIDEKKVLDGYGDALKGIIGVYYSKQKVLLEYDDAVKLVNYDYDVKCSEHEIYDDGNIYLNKCTINDKKTDKSYGEKQEKKEVKEGAIKVYVSKNSKIATLNDVKNKEDYDVYSFDIDGEYTDLELLGNKNDYVFYMDKEYKVHMINYKTGLKIFDFMNYTSVLPIKCSGEYDQKYIAVNINDKWGIYNLTNNERVVANKYNSISPSMTMSITGPSSFAGAHDNGVIAVIEDGKYGLINYQNGKVILKTEYPSMLISGDYLLAVDEYGDRHIFDYDGNEYLNDKFDTIYWSVEGKYILVKDGKEIKLVTIKGKEIYNYGEIEVGNINYGLSYNNGALFQFDNPKANGEYTNDNCVEVIYNSTDKKGEVKTSSCGGIAKPILYLYPKKTTKVTVGFEHPEILQTTYPKFNGNWKVTAKSNGDLYDKNNKYYYGLYWDEAKVHSVDFSTGFYVTKDNAIEFLEQKLDYIGLSEREANEFIMYWLPILEKNEKNLVYFELTEERESYNKINISPKPDSLLRVVIHIKKVDKKVEIPKQSLTKFQRKGFVAVEWGGTTY